MKPSIENIASNFLDRNILIFLLGQVIGLGLAAIIDLSSETVLVVYFLCTICWALAFPVMRGLAPLNKRKVDFCYYVVGSLGVVLAFVSISAKSTRSKFFYEHEYNIAADAHRDAVASRLNFFLSTQAIVTQLAVLKPLAKEHPGPEQINRACSEETPVNGAGEPVNARAQVPDVIKDHALFLPESQMCEFFANVYLDIERLEQPTETDWEASEISLEKARTLVLPNTEKIFQYAQDPPTSLRWQARKRLVARRVTAALVRKQRALRRYEQAGAPAQLSFFENQSTNLIYYLWPYVILSALGMKIAREPYAILRDE